MGGVLPPAYLEFESRRFQNGIGYIRFNTFHSELIPDMVEAVAALKDAPGIIIDLRGNPGGDPITAEELAAQFLDGEVSFGKFVIRDGSIPRVVNGKNVYSGPLVVLIDATSFSASEYFSSNMQTADRAVIIGNQSPGGVTAMNVDNLPYGGLLGFPVAQLVTSDGRVLEGVGVTPDITVSLDRNQLLQGTDAQLQAGIDYLTDQGGLASGTELSPGCSVFTISKDGQVFFGGNDDYINPDSYYWVDPGYGEDYGAIWIGTPDNVQQGVNEKGLAYDANGLPRVNTHPHREREAVVGDYTSYPIHILHECATVEEVIEWANTHQWHSYMHDQMQFADASGDAVVISAGMDGELAFTRKPAGDGFLVSTNFNVANPSNGFGYPCERYETATKQLSKLVKQEELTAQDAASVLEAVSVSGGTSWTLESMVADLPRGVVYLYYFRQYDKPVALNVAEEIANDRPSGLFSQLFPEEVRQEAARRYQRALTSQDLCDQIGKAWISLVIISLVVMIVFSIRNPRGLFYWLPVTLILGPLGLLVWLIAGRKQEARPWQAALLEATGHLPPIVVTFMLALFVIILIPQAQSSGLVLILFIFALPLLLGWLFYQGPLLAITSRRGYLRTLGQRLPAVWVATNLGIAGIDVLALRGVKWIAGTCSLMELSLWTLVSFWVAVAVGACLGLLLILPYEGWAVRQGYRAWSVLALSKGEVSTPAWRKLWWWILLSFAILFCALFVNELI
jgi:hypothetical protein